MIAHVLENLKVNGVTNMNQIKKSDIIANKITINHRNKLRKYLPLYFIVPTSTLSIKLTA